MKKKPSLSFTRRAVVQALMATIATPLAAGAPLVSERPPKGRGLLRPPGPEALVKKARLSGDVAFAVADAKTGEILEARTPELGIAPASVTKAITALYALDTLGAAHRFKTRVIATGGVTDGVVRGDLVLVGGSDPTTDTRAFAALAAQLKEAGIREVKGDFRVYEGPVATVRSIDPEQPDHVGYSPAVAGIALNFNRVHFEWKRAGGKYTVTMDARAGRYRPEVDIARMKVVQRRAPIYTYEEANGRDNWTVASGALGSGGSRWLPVRRPGLYAGEVFATLARSHGIVLPAAKMQKAAPEGTVLAEIESKPLSDVLRAMLKYSNNLTAEMIGMAATQARTGQARSLAASAREMNAWAKDVLNMQSPAFVDHSGLGGDSRVSAQDMVRGLGAIGHAALLRPLLKPVKLLDSQGRLVNEHPVQADAKTGTLNFVSGLGGYVTTPEGRELVFAIFVADEGIRAGITRAQRERPPGGRSYATRARRLQRQLIMRWGAVYDSAA
ncbi:D-alanyl-D-alanine carboxypeptidase/D-alanyl-D-alanine endopeptidase [Roseobacter litoralis]|uniref:D-alanyl-D-alanine carboxypeptidase/D-alanyl-D-alanine endopeptidase n=1 Tax=Roseobacter litoralis TaxID=42443 RepID=UPI002493DA44|nr:D-alanyl-D-alanine carboxypeptidase/D-alanyl-D-alanine-endopeptidase [Roseobacter litoralis]